MATVSVHQAPPAASTESYKPLHNDAEPSMIAKFEEREMAQAQHEVYTGSFGYCLHPAINASENSLHVAAVGNGMPVFLSELASHLPSTARLHGFSTTIGDLHSSVVLPEIVQLHVANTLQGFPAHFHGTFDVVTVRLLVASLAGHEWQLMIKNLMKLLKKGGWLQWQEPDSLDTFKVCEDDVGEPSSNLQSLVNNVLANGAAQEKFGYPSQHLEATLTQCGLFGVTREVVRTDSQPYLQCFAALLAVREMVAGMGIGFEGNPQTPEEIEARMRGCMEDLENGGILVYGLICFVGIKP